MYPINMWFANQNVLIGRLMGEWSFGQLLGQNNKVVHWPARLSDTVELQLLIQVVIRETTVLSPWPLRLSTVFSLF